LFGQPCVEGAKRSGLHADHHLHTLAGGRGAAPFLQRLPVAAGTATLTVFLAAAILLPKSTSQVLRDSAFNIELAGDQWLRRPAPSDLKVIVIDIDRASIDALGTWPRPRETMARLVEAVATGRHPDATPAWQLQRYSRDLGQRPGASSSR